MATTGFLAGDDYDWTKIDSTKLKPAVQPDERFQGTTPEVPATPAAPAPPSYQGNVANDWVSFTDQLSGVQGFDAAAGRSGASAAAGSARGNLQPIVDQFNAAHPGMNAKVVNGDKVDFGQGPVDVIRDAGGGQSGFWYGQGSGGSLSGAPSPGGSGSPAPPWAAPSPTPAPAFDAGPDVQGPGAFTPTSAAPAVNGPGAFTPNQTRAVNPNAGAPQSEVDQAARQGILDLMARSQPGAIDPNTDPNLAPQLNAYATARERAANKQRSALAERAASSGLNQGGAGGGSLNLGLGDIYSTAGQDTANFSAGLVGQEVTARRADLQQSLQLANSVGARDEAQKIQLELADLDNQYRYAGLNQSGQQANQGMKLQADVANQGNEFNTASLNQSGKLANQDQALRAALANQMNRQNTNQLNSQSQLGNRGLDVQTMLGNRGLDVQQNLGQGNLDLAGRRLDQDTSQWNDTYGLDKAKFGADLNRDAMIQALFGNA